MLFTTKRDLRYLFSLQKTILIVYSYISIFHVIKSVDVLRPRGVPLSKASFYQADKPFTCLDGSNTIPFHMVNDDYCDCSDGTDEPGTAACPNGIFHCPNINHIPKDIIASLVNDGICDCCDGSDEYDSRKECSNTCEEFGRKVREAAEKRASEMNEGFEIRNTLITEAKQMKEEKQIQLQELKTKKEELEMEKEELEVAKQTAEEAEKAAKDEHQKKWDEEKAKRDAEREVLKIAAAFSDLDTNADGIVNEEELLLRTEFDVDSDGTVTREELVELLADDTLHYDSDTFHDRIWDEIKDVYVPTQAPPASGEGDTATPAPDTPPAEDHDVDEDYPDEDYPEEEEEDGSEGGEDHEDIHEDTAHELAARRLTLHPEGVVPDQDTLQPEYDESTQALIKAADDARSAYDSCQQRLSTVSGEVSGIERTLSQDAGQHDEFLELEQECLELSDKEYTYRMCVFDKVVQKPKLGGQENNLGVWQGWTGPESDKYSEMTYSNGAQCWNGPQRSTKVTVSCAKESRIISASEPNRCEYAMHFLTPAACTHRVTADEVIRSDQQPGGGQLHLPHDEL